MTFKPDAYFKAKTVEEVTQLLGERGDEAAILAGGTVFHELVAKDMLPQVRTLIDIAELDLSSIEADQDTTRIGATTKLCQIRDAPVFGPNTPYGAVGEAASILPIQVVEMATIGGNICAGLPILNFPPVIVALDAQLKVVGPEGERTIPAGEFYLDYFLTDMQPNELLVEARLPKLSEGTATVFQASKILSLDYPTISIAARLTLDGDGKCGDVSLAFGSVGRIPARALKAEERLKGKSLDDDTIRGSVKSISEEIEPISDLRAPAEYRKEMARVLAEDALIRARERLAH